MSTCNSRFRRIQGPYCQALFPSSWRTCLAICSVWARQQAFFWIATTSKGRCSVLYTSHLQKCLCHDFQYVCRSWKTSWRRASLGRGRALTIPLLAGWEAQALVLIIPAVQSCAAKWYRCENHRHAESVFCLFLPHVAVLRPSGSIRTKTCLSTK